jgi:malonyl-CoA O-methyltransferase
MQDNRRGSPLTVAGHFDRAAGYDDHARVQPEVARGLAETIAALPLPPAARVLEIGCGTGALAEMMLERAEGRALRWMATDIAPAMVERARLRLAGHEGLSFGVMDGERPDLAGPFDLICSSLALQWFGDLEAGIGRLRALLAPGGWLAFTTLAAGSFAEWRAAHGDVPAGLHAYPDAEALAAMGLEVRIRHHLVPHASARDFLRSFKDIGAGAPRPGHRPLSPADLRRVMAAFEAGGAVARYVVATCIGRPQSLSMG